MTNVTLLTEKDAATKWCPLDKGSFSDRHIGGPQPHCIASACMAWRKAGQIGIGPAGERRTRDLDGRTKWVDTGFCGAFGKVEP